MPLPTRSDVIHKLSLQSSDHQTIMQKKKNPNSEEYSFKPLLEDTADCNLNGTKLLDIQPRSKRKGALEYRHLQQGRVHTSRCIKKRKVNLFVRLTPP